jgi:hypothetical protein
MGDELARHLISRHDAFGGEQTHFFAVGLVTTRLHVPLVGSCLWVATSRRKRIRIINQSTNNIASVMTQHHTDARHFRLAIRSPKNISKSEWLRSQQRVVGTRQSTGHYCLALANSTIRKQRGEMHNVAFCR